MLKGRGDVRIASEKVSGGAFEAKERGRVWSRKELDEIMGGGDTELMAWHEQGSGRGRCTCDGKRGHQYQ